MIPGIGGIIMKNKNSIDGKFMLASKAVYVDGEKVYLSKDYGKTWNYLDLPLERFNCLEISSNGQIILAASLVPTSGGGTSPGFIYTSQNGGNTFTKHIIQNFWSSCCMSYDGKYQFVCSNSGQIHRSEDFGTTWQAVFISTTWSCIACDANGQNLLAGVYNGKFYKSIDYGQNWSIEINTIAYYNDCAISSDGINRLIAQDQSDYSLISVNGGLNYLNIYYTDALHVAMSGNAKYQAICPASIGSVEHQKLSSDYGQTFFNNYNLSFNKQGFSYDGKYLFAPDSYGSRLSSDYGQTWTNTIEATVVAISKLK